MIETDARFDVIALRFATGKKLAFLKRKLKRKQRAGWVMSYYMYAWVPPEGSEDRVSGAGQECGAFGSTSG